MPARVILVHRRSPIREGISTLVVVTLTMAGLVVFLHVCFPGLKEQDPWFYYVFNGIALGIGTLGVFGYAVPNLLLRRPFEFTLFEDRVECRSPAEWYGQSYSIPVSDIVALEEESNEGSNSWYFVTRDDRRILITPNYGNPVRTIVAELGRLRPEIVVRDA